MKVSKKSLNYRAWKWWHTEGKEPTNLCRYFWFCVAQWSLLPLLLAVLGFFGGLFSGFGWFIGFRQNFFIGMFNSKKSAPWPRMNMPYKTDLYNWTRRKRRYKVAPWEAISASLVIWYFLPMMKAFGRGLRELGDGIVYHWKTETITTSVIAAVILFVYIMCRRETREYLRAKKQRWCPMIEVTD